MDTARVDITYRPLRIAWAIHSNDREAFRQCVQHSNTLAGGRFNPIILADAPGAADVVRAYRADFIQPLGDSAEVAALVAEFPHLPPPYFGNSLHYQDAGRRGRSRVLDIENILSHARRDGDWHHFANEGFVRARWSDEDPLRDVFLMELGQFPPAEKLGIDYDKIFDLAAKPSDVAQVEIEAAAAIPCEAYRQPSLAFASRWSLERHYSIGNRRDGAGFYVGDATSITDIVEFWNLRASDTPVRFFDPSHVHRYALVHDVLQNQLAQDVQHLDEFGRHLTVYSSNEMAPEAVRAVVPMEETPFFFARSRYGTFRSGANDGLRPGDGSWRRFAQSPDADDLLRSERQAFQRRHLVSRSAPCRIVEDDGRSGGR